MRRGTRVARSLLPGLGLILLLAGPMPARAAAASFGRGDVDTEFGRAITFTIPITVSEPLERVELRLRYPGSLGPFIETIPGPTESQTLEYTISLSGGAHIVPNTTIEATWAAVPRGGGEPVLSEVQTVRYSDTSQDWRSLEGELVTVHWHVGGEAFARRALEIGDAAVQRTADLLGVTETEPIDFFIYGDEAAFRTALGPGTRENVGGQAHADIRTLFALITPEAIDDAWVGIVIPHELVHLVFDTAVQNPYRFPPRWVNEGLAVYLSEGYGAFDRSTVEDAARDGELLPLTALTGQFPTEPDKTYLAYAESVSAIAHLVDISDQDTLLTLIRSYREGLTDDEAFGRALGMDVAAFQASWLASIGARAPTPYGPVPNPPGPLPPGWDRPVDGQPTAGAADAGLVAVAVVVVVIIVIAGMVVARRRTARP
jgi:hypothetical protein